MTSLECVFIKNTLVFVVVVIGWAPAPLANPPCTPPKIQVRWLTKPTLSFTDTGQDQKKQHLATAVPDSGLFPDFQHRDPFQTDFDDLESALRLPRLVATGKVIYKRGTQILGGPKGKKIVIYL